MNVRERVVHKLHTRYMASEISRADIAFLLDLHDVCSKHGLSLDLDNGDGYGEAKLTFTTWSADRQLVLAESKRGEDY